MKSIFLLLLASFVFTANAQQKLIYAETNTLDKIKTRFQIIGEVGGNILIYKEITNERFISVYNKQMQEIEHRELQFLPKKVYDIMFINYFDFCYLIYQFQKKHVFYCYAIKLDKMGNSIGDTIQLNAVKINYFANQPLFQNIVSDKKNYIMSILGISHYIQSSYQCTFKLFDAQLQLKKANSFKINFDETNQSFSPFLLDNNANLVFARTQKDSVVRYSSNVSLLIKRLQSDTIAVYPMHFPNGGLDQVKIKIDNLNNRYILASLYYDAKLDKINGLLTDSWDEASETWKKRSIYFFGDSSSAITKTKIHYDGFDDSFIKDIITEKNGHYILIIESEIFGNYSLGYPVSRHDIFLNSPIYFDYGRRRYESHLNRSITGNILFFAFDADNQPEWNNEIQRSDFDIRDNSKLSYKVFQTASNIHILYNIMSTISPLLTDDTVSVSGEIAANQSLKYMDMKYEILVRLGKQINDRQMVLPFLKKEALSFALFDLDN